MIFEDEGTLSVAGESMRVCRAVYQATTHGTLSAAIAMASWERASDEYDRIRIILDGPDKGDIA